MIPIPTTLLLISMAGGVPPGKLRKPLGLGRLVDGRLVTYIPNFICPSAR